MTDSAEHLARRADGPNIQPQKRSPRRLPLNFLAAGFLCIFLASLSGCSVWNMVDRTLHRELVQYPRTTEGHRSLRTYRQWAKQAWQDHELQGGAQASNSEYRRGFIDGFVDYVDAGGSGEPPAIPPRRFWRVDYRSPAGDLAVRQWGDGFRAGATAARSGGYRQRAVLPANVPNVEDQLAHGPVTQSPVNQGQQLTQPRPVTPLPLNQLPGPTAALSATPQPALKPTAAAQSAPANSRPIPSAAATPAAAKSVLVKNAPDKTAPDKTAPAKSAPAKSVASKTAGAKPSPSKSSLSKSTLPESLPSNALPSNALGEASRSPKSAPAQPLLGKPAPALASILQQPDPRTAADHSEETPFQDQLTLAVTDLVGSQSEVNSSAVTERPVAKSTRDDRPQADSVLSAESTDISTISVDLSGAPAKPVHSLEELAQRTPAAPPDSPAAPPRSPADPPRSLAAPPRSPAPQAVDTGELSPSPPWLSAGESLDAPEALAVPTPATPARPGTPARPATPKVAPISRASAEGPPVPPGWSEASVEASPFQDSTSESGR